MTRVFRSLVLGTALIAATGCTTVMDETVGLIGSAIGPRADKTADGSYALPTFSIPDDGTRFSAKSAAEAHNSLARMVTGMNKSERQYFARVFGSLGYYHGCKDRGRRSYVKNAFANPRQYGICNMSTFYDDSKWVSLNLIYRGRPDSEVVRTVQRRYLLGGAPIGEPYNVGYGSATAWNRWIEWSGHRLDGMTRTEIVAFFLDKTNGRFGNQQQLSQRPYPVQGS